MSPFLIALIVLAAAATLFFAAVYFIADKSFRQLFGRTDDRTKEDAELREKILRSPYPEALSYYDSGVSWLRSVHTEALYIKSRDGLSLCASFIGGGAGRGTVIMCHGFHGSPESDFAPEAEYLFSLGFDLLLINQRAHMKSEGKYLTFGALEKFDIADWCAMVTKRFPHRPVILYGISMGCSSVLLASALPGMDGAVSGIIADCGYSDAVSEIAYVMRSKTHIPLFPALAMLRLCCRLRGHFSLSDCSPVRVVGNVCIPALFICGEEDRFVPIKNTTENYNAYKGEKTLLTVPRAAHASSCLADRERYNSALRALCEKAVNRQMADT